MLQLDLANLHTPPPIKVETGLFVNAVKSVVIEVGWMILLVTA